MYFSSQEWLAINHQTKPNLTKPILLPTTCNLLPTIQWHSQDFSLGGGSALVWGPTVCKRGPQNYDLYFLMPVYRKKTILWTDSTWFFFFLKIKLNLLTAQKSFWVKLFYLMHDSISFSNNWINSANDSSGPKIFFFETNQQGSAPPPPEVLLPRTGFEPVPHMT